MDATITHDPFAPDTEADGTTIYYDGSSDEPVFTDDQSALIDAVGEELSARDGFHDLPEDDQAHQFKIALILAANDAEIDITHDAEGRVLIPQETIDQIIEQSTPEEEADAVEVENMLQREEGSEPDEPVDHSEDKTILRGLVKELEKENIIEYEEKVKNVS